MVSPVQQLFSWAVLYGGTGWEAHVVSHQLIVNS